MFNYYNLLICLLQLVKTDVSRTSVTTSVATCSQPLANERRKTEAREEYDGRFGAHNRRKNDNDKEARETDKKA